MKAARVARGCVLCAVVCIIVCGVPSAAWSAPDDVSRSREAAGAAIDARTAQVEEEAAREAERRVRDAMSTELAERTAAIRSGVARSNPSFTRPSGTSGLESEWSSAVQDARATRLWDIIGVRELTFFVGVGWLLMEARRRVRRRQRRSSGSSHAA